MQEQALVEAEVAKIDVHRTITSLVGDSNAGVEKSFKLFNDKSYTRTLVFDVSIASCIKAFAQFAVVRLLQDRLRITKADKAETIEKKREYRKKTLELLDTRQKLVPVSRIFAIFGADPEETKRRSKVSADTKLRKMLESTMGKISDEMFAGIKAAMSAKYEEMVKLEESKAEQELDPDVLDGEEEETTEPDEQ